MKPERVTDFRVDEAEILESDFYKLPLKAKTLLEAYWEPLISPPGKIRFRIAIYRWDEIRAALAVTEPKGSTRAKEVFGDGEN